MTLLAYSIFRREHDVQLFTFTDQADKLTKLDQMPRTNLQMAKAFLESKLVSIQHGYSLYQKEIAFNSCLIIQQIDKTSQNLTTPIKYATVAKKKIDVFVVVVDSVARFCRSGQVPLTEFVEYRNNVNAGAK